MQNSKIKSDVSIQNEYNYQKYTHLLYSSLKIRENSLETPKSTENKINKNVPSLFKIKFCKPKIGLKTEVKYYDEYGIFEPKNNQNDFKNSESTSTQSNLSQNYSNTSIRGILKDPNRKFKYSNSLKKIQNSSNVRSKKINFNESKIHKTRSNFLSERKIKIETKCINLSKVRKDMFGNLINFGKKDHCIVLNTKPNIIEVECWKNENKKMNFTITKKQYTKKSSEIFKLNQKNKKKNDSSLFFQNTMSSIFMIPML